MRRGEKGFSIVEMMITMLIFLIVVASVYGLLQVGFADRNRASRHANILKNARVAIHLIGRDALNAGLSYHQTGGVVPRGVISERIGGLLDGSSNSRDFLTAVLPGNNVNTNDLDPSVRTDVISFVYRDLTFNNGNTIRITGASIVNIDTLDLLTTSGGTVNSNAFDLYLVETNSSQPVVMATQIPNSSRIRVKAGDPLGINQQTGGSIINQVSLLIPCNPPLLTTNCTTYPASAKKIIWVAYRVLPNGTLVRTTFGNNTGAPESEQIRDIPIAYNVQDFQVQYVMDDGRVLDDPVAGPDGIRGNANDNPLAMNDVRQINIAITVQSPEIDEQTRMPMSITLRASFSMRNVLYFYDAG